MGSGNDVESGTARTGTRYRTRAVIMEAGRSLEEELEQSGGEETGTVPSEVICCLLYSISGTGRKYYLDFRFRYIIAL